MKIKFTYNKPLPAGHLFCNVTCGNVYTVIDKYVQSVAIVDDVGEKVWVSKTSMKKYFKRKEWFDHVDNETCLLTLA